MLLSRLILFRYIFPRERSAVPASIYAALLDRARSEPDVDPAEPPWCRGTLLSSLQYAVDIDQRGYRDARLPAIGRPTPDQIASWEAWLAEEHSRCNRNLVFPLCQGERADSIGVRPPSALGASTRAGPTAGLRLQHTPQHARNS